MICHGPSIMTPSCVWVQTNNTTSSSAGFLCKKVNAWMRQNQESLAHDYLPSFTIIDHAVKFEMIEGEERDVKIIYMIILHWHGQKRTEVSKHSCNSMSSDFPRPFPVLPIRNPSDFSASASVAWRDVATWVRTSGRCFMVDLGLAILWLVDFPFYETSIYFYIIILL